MWDDSSALYAKVGFFFVERFENNQERDVTLETANVLSLLKADTEWTAEVGKRTSIKTVQVQYCCLQRGRLTSEIIFLCNRS